MMVKMDTPILGNHDINQYIYIWYVPHMLHGAGIFKIYLHN